MSIIDDAKGESEECPYAPAVVRVAALADWLDGKAEQWKAEGDDASAFDGHEVAACIRAALEGDEQPPHIDTVSSKEAEVDRWLAERDRQMRAEGWDEGYADARDDEHEHRPGLKNTNPHKEKP